MSTAETRRKAAAHAWGRAFRLAKIAKAPHAECLRLANAAALRAADVADPLADLPRAKELLEATLVVQVPVSWETTIERLAKSQGMTKSQVVRAILAKALT